ncbi:hypothetical protein Vpro01_00664 [Vibrio proteolyticus]
MRHYRQKIYIFFLQIVIHDSDVHNSESKNKALTLIINSSESAKSMMVNTEYLKNTLSELSEFRPSPKACYLGFALLFITILTYSVSMRTAPDTSAAWRLPPLEEPPISVEHPVTSSFRIYNAHIQGSFFISALDAGMSSYEISTLVSTLNSHFNFVTIPEDGAEFSVEFDDIKSSKVRAFYYKDQGKQFFAMRYKNGHFYNQDGVALEEEAFLLQPTTVHFPISSGFDLDRLHPITRRVTPHHGTDYMTPVGTPVMSIGSGEVIVSRYDRFAGNYITVRHSNGYATRYLHLSKRYVHKGQIIKKGQPIGLTGNTGRTTGPHLHFELLSNGKAIDFERYRYQLKSPKSDILLSRAEKKEMRLEIQLFMARVAEQQQLGLAMNSPKNNERPAKPLAQ